jgi:ABC-2 type transport system ATP-binding protein
LVSLYSTLYSRRRDVAELLERVGLADKAKARTKTLSGGQRRRLDLALGLVGCPELLFLDEPTTGFDPSARRRAWDLVASMRELGTTIVLTTHYMEEAERLADRVAVIQAGHLVALDTPAHLVRAEGAAAILTFVLPEGVGPEDLPDIGVGAARTNGQRVDIRSADPTRDVNALTEWAIARGIGLEGLTMTRPTLEDVYLDLTAGVDHA